jgi:hypothetical protein
MIQQTLSSHDIQKLRQQKNVVFFNYDQSNLLNSHELIRMMRAVRRAFQRASEQEKQLLNELADKYREDHNDDPRHKNPQVMAVAAFVEKHVPEWHTHFENYRSIIKGIVDGQCTDQKYDVMEKLATMTESVRAGKTSESSGFDKMASMLHNNGFRKEYPDIVRQTTKNE